MFHKGWEGGEIYFSFIRKRKKKAKTKKRSPFPHWAWFLVWETPPFWSTDWSNSFWHNLCQRPPCLIGSLAQFCWESHPTWFGGVLSFHTVACVPWAATEVWDKLWAWALSYRRRDHISDLMGSRKAFLFSPFLWSQTRGVRLMFLLLTLHLGNWWVNSRT